ncbi:MAG: HTH-type transcriptional activator IlvY [Succinivibrionaceae bacterium]|nr:HTH-type transcriptional activator IlvY [Succinivibrionaceae bacterium]
MIDLKDAAAFLRLCETQNLTRAAALCGVSPSTLSRGISKLERDLGARLCRRDSRGITVTAAGRKFERYARSALGEYERARAEISPRAGRLEGTVKIFCSVTAAYVFIPRLMSELRLSHPGLEPLLETGDPAQALGKVMGGDADLAISALPREPLEGIGFVPLLAFPLLLIAPRAGDPAQLGGADPDPARAPFILAQAGQLRAEALAWFARQKIAPRVHAEVAGHEAIVGMCALGFGLAIVPKLVLDLSPFRNDVRILDSEHCGQFQLALCYQESRGREPIIRAVAALMDRISPTFGPDPLLRRAPEA